MCLRGHCSSVRHPATTNVDLAYSEGRLNVEALIYCRWCYPAVDTQ